MSATDEWTRVTTTFPIIPSSSARSHAATARLIIRPLAASDLSNLYALRTQPEVMAWASARRIDRDRDETAGVLGKFLPPNDASAFNCAICLRSTGEMIGIGGVHRLNRASEDGDGDSGPGAVGVYGWPELGYMIRKEHWGGGLATEFVIGFLRVWNELPRQEVKMQVNAKSVVIDGIGEDGSERATEVLIAIIDPANGASQRILEKCGFEVFDSWTEKNSNHSGKPLELQTFRYLQKERP